MASEFGKASALVGGTLQLKLPTSVQWWFLQNQSVSPLKVTFLSPTWGWMTSIILSPAPNAGEPGGYLSSIAFPYFAVEGVQLDSVDATAAFGSGASPQAPVNTFLDPGQGPTAFGR